MIKQMRQPGAYIVDIATQVGCSERTVRRYLKYPEPPARKTRHKMAKLKPFMDYIDMRLAECLERRGHPGGNQSDGLYRWPFHVALLHPAQT